MEAGELSAISQVFEMNKRTYTVLFLIALIASVDYVHASVTTLNATKPEEAIEKRVNEVVCALFNFVLMLSGMIASLVIMVAGVKYMSSEGDPIQAENAKNMVGYALTGLIMAILACPLVDYLVANTNIVPFEESCNCFIYGGGRNGTTTSSTVSGTTTTTNGGGTTTTSAATTTTTTTTIPPEKLLTVENLVSCINSKGAFYTDENCHYCVQQKNLFYAEVGADVGDGKTAYDSVLTKGNPANSPCGTGGGVIPCWSYPAQSKKEGGCKTLPALDNIYECGLVEIPGHTYKTCT